MKEIAPIVHTVWQVRSLVGELIAYMSFVIPF